ncbi:MAG TPA: hypothetical protein VE076_04515 [Nitrososphaeraceae archaeon]|nr:hypothetical protein [Nitrososphaeraceae archaeon]
MSFDDDKADLPKNPIIYAYFPLQSLWAVDMSVNPFEAYYISPAFEIISNN